MRSRLVFAAGLAICAWIFPGRAALAVPVQVLYTDGAGEGFNDPTLGAARRNAFEFALDLWASRLGGSVPVTVAARMDPLGGSGSAAVLGQSGPTTIHRDFPGAPMPATWYVGALANQLRGTDVNGSGLEEIRATFNSDVDDGTVLGSVDWYYGTDGNAGSDIDFVSVVLHELAHGLNFIDLVDPDTGAWRFEDLPGTFDRNLFQSGVGAFTSMTDDQRRSALVSENVFWGGPNVVQTAGGSVRIFAPNPYEPGSSISHWDPSLFPNQLMEPFYTGPNHDPGLAIPAFRDVGWTVPQASFSGGVFVASGDLDGDGVAEIVTGPGPGSEPLVRAFHADNTDAGVGFFAYGSGFAGGVRVASCDVTGDGRADIVTATGFGGGPHVRVFDVANPSDPVDVHSFLAYGRSFRGGVSVACGDVNGDGRGDIVTAPGAGGPHVQVFDGVSLSRIHSFFAYARSFKGGVFVAAGDVNGDGRADIVTGPAAGSPHVQVFDGASLKRVHSFFAYAPSFTGGVRVAAGDVNGDGRADVITGAGPGGSPHVRAFDGESRAGLASFLAYNRGFAGGVFVAAGDLDGAGGSEIVTGAGGAPHVRAFTRRGGATGTSFLAY